MISLSLFFAILDIERVMHIVQGWPEDVGGSTWQCTLTWLHSISLACLLPSFSGSSSNYMLGYGSLTHTSINYYFLLGFPLTESLVFVLHFRIGLVVGFNLRPLLSGRHPSVTYTALNMDSDGVF